MIPSRRLPDGLALAVRRIGADHKPLLAAGLRHASTDSVHRRLPAPRPRPTAAELRHLTGLPAGA